MLYEIGLFTVTGWNQHGLPSIRRGVMHTQTFADQNRADARASDAVRDAAGPLATPTTRQHLAQFLG